MSSFRRGKIKTRSTAGALGIACIFAGLAVAAWLALTAWLGGNYTYGVYSLAVAASCWYGGIRAGLLSTALSAVSIALVFPIQGPAIVASAGTQLVWFLATSLVICLVLAASQRATREAEEARATLDSLVHVAPVGIALFDNQMRYRLVNEALAHIDGVAAAAHLGKRAAEVLPGVAPSFEQNFKRILQTGVPIPPFEITGETPAAPGVQRTWIKSWFPVKDSDGRTIGVGAMVQDVTQEHRIERKLREADRRKDEFLAVLAHELRNPLAPIRNAVHILRLGGEAGPVQTKAVDIIDRQASHLVRLVDDLLDLARVATGKIELRKRNVELQSIVRTAVERARPLLERKRQVLDISLPPQKVVLNADGARLSQVLSNLLHNACKFTPENGRISLCTELVEAMLEIRIRDNGAGIASELLPHIFDMFAQGPQQQAEGGLGIGLSLARQLIDMHGGSIAARSDGPGRGSEFTIVLPAGAENLFERRTKQSSRMPSMQGLRLLLVEDNPDCADSLQTLFSMLGNEVATAYDGPSAIAAAERFRPDAAIIDIGLPGMTGHEVARRIRQQPGGDTIVLVALTGWGQQKDHEQSREAGFDAHLLKPLDMAQLAALLETAKRDRQRSGAMQAR